MRRIPLLAVFVILTLQGSVLARPNVGAFDIYGTEQLTLQRVEQRLGDKLRDLVDASGDPENRERARALREECISTINELGDFAYVDISIIQYYSPNEGRYLTIDLVDTKDREIRMPFRQPPTGMFEDPDGLLAAMNGYVQTGFQLLQQEEIDGVVRKEESFHQLFGFEHALLRPYLAWFNSQVPKHQETLIKILKDDQNAPSRASAAFLLAHTESAEDLVEALIPSLTDPEALVRNNAMRVLASLAENHPEVEIPLDPVLQALNYPSTTDRNKASAILAALAKKQENRKQIADSATGILLNMLRLQQPNNRDYAYMILKEVSGKNFSKDNLSAWENWARERSVTHPSPPSP